MENKTIVISGINLFEGGPLSIYYDFLKTIILKGLDKTNHIVAFVHKIELFDRFLDSSILFIELPESRKSYFKRFHYEYSYFKKYSRKNKVDIWISLHDITPNVIANRIYTYCHNPSPFRKITRIDFKTGIKNVLFPLFYKFIYKKNIQKASAIIVQQDWMREKFKKIFKVKNVVVARPQIEIQNRESIRCGSSNSEILFFYPALPRTFKNYEIICEAAKIIENETYLKFKVVLTIDGTENKYSKYIRSKYRLLKNIQWVGVLKREEVFEYYGRADCLVFPSKMETWGLPLSEFKSTGKTIFCANEPYAFETLGSYNDVSFFDTNNARELANLMVDFINGNHRPNPVKARPIQQPFFESWDGLIDFIFTC